MTETSAESVVRVDDVAAAVLKLTGPLAPTKLQKLLYYAQAWHLALRDQPLFVERIEAWQRGPVVPALWRARRYADWIDHWDEGDADQLLAAARDTVGWVVSHYGGLSAADLSRLTHLERPWIEAWGDRPSNARSDAEITHDSMKRYYRAMVGGRNSGAQTLATLHFEGLPVTDSLAARIRAVASGEADANAMIRSRLAQLRKA